MKEALKFRLKFIIKFIKIKSDNIYVWLNNLYHFKELLFV